MEKELNKLPQLVSLTKEENKLYSWKVQAYVSHGDYPKAGGELLANPFTSVVGNVDRSSINVTF